MGISRDNHYVPISYQQRFMSNKNGRLTYLDINSGKQILTHPKGFFVKKDLYTTVFGDSAQDDIERHLFGQIDTEGARGIGAIISGDTSLLSEYFLSFFQYLDAQKLRTPKGLDWIKKHYPNLDQNLLMLEMQQLRQMHCTTWLEAVREVVSAQNSEIKFLLSDHPVTIFNPGILETSEDCLYPNDPNIALKGSQTIFPLSKDYCLILTNLEYAKDPYGCNLLENRTNARSFGTTLARHDTMIRERSLKPEEVLQINKIIKGRAQRFVAAENSAVLTLEAPLISLEDQKKILLPPKEKLYSFSGEIFVGYDNGEVDYQDCYGRTTPEHSHLKKSIDESNLASDDPCICGYGRTYINCCKDRLPEDRPAVNELSIRERNLLLYRGIVNILGLAEGKTWEEVRVELTDEQVRNIYGVYESLFPRDTNIISLLPKPDPRIFRAVYSGLVDPRVLHKNILNMTLYADEILILSPFVNPACTEAIHNPLKVPTQYKQEVLRSILTLFTLYPYIEAGLVNMIPDPSDLNLVLKTQLLNAKKQRDQINQAQGKSYNVGYPFEREEEEMFICRLPDSALRNRILRANPRLSETQVIAALAASRTKNLENPLALLQPPNGEEIHTIRLNLDLELGLFLAQLTGAAIFTDIPTKSAEIQDLLIINHSTTTPYTYSIDLPFLNQPTLEQTIEISQKTSMVKDVLKETFVNFCTLTTPMDVLVKASTDVLEAVLNEFQKNRPNIPPDSYQRNLKILISTDLYTLDTQRFLFAHRHHKYLKYMPMMISLS